MGKASTSKKVARAARAGGSPHVKKRNWMFPAALAAIAVVGVAVILVAKNPTTASASGPSVGDHWHNAYGIYVCDKFLPPLTDITPDKTGLHTHGDGIAHIHPFQGGYANGNATLGAWGKTTGITFGDNSFTLADGTKYADGFDCNGQPATVSVWKWTDALGANSGPTQITSNFGGIKFSDNYAAFTIAVVPDGVTPPEPDLARLRDIAGGAPEDPAASTPSTVTASTVPVVSTTAAP